MHDGRTLPFAKGKRVAVIGPHALAQQAMVGNYLGEICPDNGFDCVLSPYAALVDANQGANVTAVLGCAINSTDKSGFPAAIAAAQAADYVVLMMGIDTSIEREGQDRCVIACMLVGICLLQREG